jgi:uncharacterized tellurite resistance protein B-like protein
VNAASRVAYEATMFFRNSSKPATPSEAFRQLIYDALGAADDETKRLTVAVAGLLACVAYADREYSAAEQARVRETLAQVEGLGPTAVDAICDALREHIVVIAVGNTQAYTRELRELGELELRRQVLDMLVDLAAADDELSMAETDLLRRTAAAMGLTPDDYLRSQTRYRDRLSVLK